MNAQDIRAAVNSSHVNVISFCTSLNLVIPVLKNLRKDAGGWKFWLKWGMDALIYALEKYQDEVCHGDFHS